MTSDDMNPGEGSYEDKSELVLWNKFTEHHDHYARQELINLHLEFAKMLASVSFSNRINLNIPFNEFQQLAVLGLIEAVDGYDPSFQVPFRAYAQHRIKGAMIDGLANFSELHSQIGLQQRLRIERMQSLVESDPLQLPREERPKEVFANLAELGVGLALAWMLEHTGMIKAHEDEWGACPYEFGQEMASLQADIKSCLSRLNDKERRVIYLHYFQELPYQHIANILSLSKGRVAQLHRSALANLRQLLKPTTRVQVQI